MILRPIVPKSYDDTYLRPPNTRIGERACACGSRCLCQTLAEMRHGEESELAFIGTEFLLPDERTKFLAGDGLPLRRKKCLVCTRYWTNFIYISARTDPAFSVSAAPIGVQAFGNTVGTPDEAEPPDLAELGRTMGEMPASASIVHARDGYKPDAMLFVDEEFAQSSRASREGARLASVNGR